MIAWVSVGIHCCSVALYTQTFDGAQCVEVRAGACLCLCKQILDVEVSNLHLLLPESRMGRGKADPPRSGLG